MFCGIAFVSFVRPSLLGANQLRIGADSSTYLALAGIVNSNDPSLPVGVPMVSIGSNLLGPVLLAKLLKSVSLMAVANCLIFVCALWIAAKFSEVRLGLFFFLLILNPMTLPALLTVNKEIFALCSSVLLAYYLRLEKRNLTFLSIVLGISFLARWEQALVTGLFLYAESRHSLLRGKPKTVLCLLIAAITLIYPFLARSGVVDMAALLSVAGSVSEGGRLMPTLNNIQAAYGFPILVVPKTLLNLFGQVLNPTYFFTDYLKVDFADIQNSIAIPWHCVLMFVICVLAAIRRKLVLRSSVIYWIAMYEVVAAAAPLFQPRYQYPVYVLLCLELSGFVSPIVGISHSVASVTRRKLWFVQARGAEGLLR
jgi:hypothetical protein